MLLTTLQSDLFECLRKMVSTKADRRIVYYSEWLGYLPYGLYHWVIIGGQDVSLSLPQGWSRTDFDALERAGLVAKTEEYTDPHDSCETKAVYEVIP